MPAPSSPILPYERSEQETFGEICDMVLKKKTQTNIMYYSAPKRLTFLIKLCSYVKISQIITTYSPRDTQGYVFQCHLLLPLLEGHVDARIGHLLGPSIEQMKLHSDRHL